MGLRNLVVCAAIAIATTATGVCAKAHGIAPAPGFGDWVSVGGEYYRGSSYVWRAYRDGCYGWKYQRVLKLDDPDFYTHFADLMAKADSDDRKAQLIESRWPPRLRTPAASYETTGYSILQQGYQPSLIQSGTTLQATGPSYAPIDINGMVHEAQRLQELAGVNSSQANAQVNTIVNSAVDGNSRYASIIAAGQVSAAAIAAATPPTQQTTVFRSTQTSGTTQAGASAGGGAAAPAILSHALLMENCSGCHSPRKLSGNLDLTVDPAALGAVRALIEQKIVSGEMPKDHPHLAEAVVNGMLAGIPRQTFAATPPIPQQPEDQPPLPPQQ